MDDLDLRRRLLIGLGLAVLASMIAAATVRITAHLAVSTFYLFSAMCALFLGMSIIRWYMETKDRTKLLFYGVSVFCCIGALVAFIWSRDDMSPDTPDLRTVRGAVTAGVVAITWGMVAAWLIEALMKRKRRLDAEERHEHRR